MATPAVRNISGTGYQALQLPNKSAGQQDLFRQLMGGSSGNIASILQQLGGMAGGDADWETMEKPAWTAFNQGLGQIGSRFSAGGGGPGAMSSRRSSAFNNATGGYASDFAEKLASNRMGLQRDAQTTLLNLYRSLLGEDMYTTGLIPKKKNAWQELLGSGAQGFGQSLGMLPGFFI